MAVCKIHGGNSLVGIASATFVSGRHSRNLPARLSADYERAISDPDVIALRSEIALTDARLNDLLARVDTGESGEIWRSLRQTYAVAMEAQDDMNRLPSEGVDFLKAKQTYHEAIETVGTLIAEGAQDYQAWDEVHKMVGQRRVLVDTEVKRIKEAQNSITADKVMVLMASVLGLIRENVTDRDTLRRLQTGVDVLLSSVPS